MPFEVKYVISGPDSDNPKRGAVPYFYQGPVVERLSGEQLWDSLVALNYPDIDKRINSRFPGGGFDQYQRYISMTAEELFLERLGIPAPGSGMDMQDAMANSPNRSMKIARSDLVGWRTPQLPQKMKKVKQLLFVVMVAKINLSRTCQRWMR